MFTANGLSPRSISVLVPVAHLHLIPGVGPSLTRVHVIAPKPGLEHVILDHHHDEEEEEEHSEADQDHLPRIPVQRTVLRLDCPCCVIPFLSIVRSSLVYI